MSTSKKGSAHKCKLASAASVRGSSPVNAAVEAGSECGPALLGTDEHPPKRAKTTARISAGGCTRQKELLPPVTITASSVSVAARRGVMRKAMSIGDLSGDDIDAIVSADCSRAASPVVERDARVTKDLLDLEAVESGAEYDAADTSAHSACGDVSCSEDGHGNQSDDSFIISDSVDVLGADREAHMLSNSDDATIEAPVHTLKKSPSRFSGRGRVPVDMEKGNYVASLLESSKQEEVADSDNDDQDPSVMVSPRSAQLSKGGRAVVPTTSPEVFLDDLYPEQIMRSHGTPKKAVAGRGNKASPKKGSKTDPPVGNKVMTVELDIDPVTSSLRKTVGLGMPKSKDPEHDAHPRTPSKSVSGSRIIRSSAAAAVGTKSSNDSIPASPIKGARHASDRTADMSSQLAFAGSNAHGFESDGDAVERVSPRKADGKKVVRETESVSVPSEKARGKQPDRAPSRKVEIEDVVDEDDESEYISCSLHEKLSKLLRSSARESSPKGETSGPVLCLGSVSRVIPTVLALNMSEPEDETLWVMQGHLMEEHLIVLQIYERLPPLGSFRPVVPIGLDLDSYDAPMFFTFDDVKEIYSVSALTCMALLECFKFTNFGCYVNPATLPPIILSLHNRKACIDMETAVCIMPGVVSECLLFDSTVQGRYQGATSVHGGKWSHRIQIKPLQQMWRHDQTAWSVILDLAYGESLAVSDSGVSFPMRVEDLSGKTNKNSCYPSVPSSPSKWWSSGKPSGKPLKSTIPPRVGAGYPSLMGFGDEVPIYDGRERASSHFLFRPMDFSMLKLMPRYTEERDLDAFTLVAIRYLLGVWSGYNDQPRVSTNVLFVIVLGSAPPARTLAARNLLV